MLERKIETKDWLARVGHTIFGMIVVDTWLVYKGATDTNETQQDFYTFLAEELIDNTFDTMGGNGIANLQPGEDRVTNAELVDRVTGAGQAGVNVHLTPTKKKQKQMGGAVTNHSLQGRCRVCSKKTRHVCSACNDDNENLNDPVMWLCHTETGRMCFPEHATNLH